MQSKNKFSFFIHKRKWTIFEIVDKSKKNRKIKFFFFLSPPTLSHPVFLFFVFLEHHYRKANITLTYCIWHVRELIRFLLSFIYLNFRLPLRSSQMQTETKEKRENESTSIAIETIEHITLFIIRRVDAYWSIFNFRWFLSLPWKWAQNICYEAKRG